MSRRWRHSPKPTVPTAPPGVPPPPRRRRRRQNTRNRLHRPHLLRSPPCCKRHRRRRRRQIHPSRRGRCRNHLSCCCFPRRHRRRQCRLRHRCRFRFHPLRLRVHLHCRPLKSGLRLHRCHPCRRRPCRCRCHRRQSRRPRRPGPGCQPALNSTTSPWQRSSKWLLPCRRLPPPPAASLGPGSSNAAL